MGVNGREGSVNGGNKEDALIRLIISYKYKRFENIHNYNEILILIGFLKGLAMCSEIDQNELINMLKLIEKTINESNSRYVVSSIDFNEIINDDINLTTKLVLELKKLKATHPHISD